MQQKARRSKPKGKCTRCGKEPRALNDRSNNVLVCNECQKELLTPVWLESLRNDGFDVNELTTKAEAGPLMGALCGPVSTAYHYALDVWEDVRGKRAIYDELMQSHEPRTEVNQLVIEVWRTDPAYVERIAGLQQKRDDKAPLIERDGWEPIHDRAPLKRNKDYKRMVDLLSQRFPGFAPRKRLIGLFG